MSGRTPYFSALVEYHDRERFEPALVTLAQRGTIHQDWESAGAPAYALHWRGRQSAPRTLLQLVAHLRKHRYDVVQTHLYDATVLGAFGSRLAGVPLVIGTGHHTNDSALQRQVHGKHAAFLLDRAAVRSCHRIIAPSAFAKATIVSSYGVPDKDVAVVHFGLTHHGAEVGARVSVRRELQLGDDVAFVAVGRLHWIKNIPALLEAFSVVRERSRGVRLLLVGNGPEEAAVRQAVSRLGLFRSVVLTGHRIDVPRVLEAADVFVHASLTESFNQALVEAMLACRPAVTTAVGVATDLIAHRETGFLARPGDARELAEGMLWALANRDAWGEMGRRNREAAAHLTYSAMVRNYEALYLEWMKDD